MGFFQVSHLLGGCDRSNTNQSHVRLNLIKNILYYDNILTWWNLEIAWSKWISDPTCMCSFFNRCFSYIYFCTKDIYRGTCSAEFCDKNRHLFGFGPHIFIYVFEPLMNILTLCGNNLQRKSLFYSMRFKVP